MDLVVHRQRALGLQHEGEQNRELLRLRSDPDDRVGGERHTVSYVRHSVAGLVQNTATMKQANGHARRIRPREMREQPIAHAGRFFPRDHQRRQIHSRATSAFAPSARQQDALRNRSDFRMR